MPRKDKAFAGPSAEERAALALRVYEAVLDSTESFEVQFVGANLAYLMGAILRGPPNYKENMLALDVQHEGHPEFLAVLRKAFPPGKIPERDHDVWQYVTLEDNGNPLSRDTQHCIVAGEHLTNCDDDGFCNHCGEQEGAEWMDALALGTGADK
jgi:hypothetical protein